MHGPAKDYWILGLNFFTNYYTVFDYENKSIGFAKSVNFLKPVEMSFVNWATGVDTEIKSPYLMNLAMNLDGSQLQMYEQIALVSALILMISLFLCHYCKVKQNQRRPLQAVLDVEA